MVSSAIRDIPEAGYYTARGRRNPWVNLYIYTRPFRLTLYGLDDDEGVKYLWLLLTTHDMTQLHHSLVIVPTESTN